MMFSNNKMKSVTFILSGFAISPLAATGDFFPLPPDELQYYDDQGDVPDQKNCPLNCMHNATCTSKAATGLVGESSQATNTEWSCECPAGFHGDLCEQQDDLCGDDSCKHGSKCIPIGQNEHMCDCTPAYTDNTYYAGKYCQFPSTIFCTGQDHPEGRQFCVNEGSCGPQDHAPCICPKGFAGPRCATRVDNDSAAYAACSLQCMNDGTCHKGEKGMEAYGKFAVDVSHLIQETHINFEHCICPRGYFGVKCEYQYEECGGQNKNEHMCMNGGSCEVAQDGSHRCACLDDYYGHGCEFEILKAEKKSSRYHPILRIIGHGVWAVIIVAIATVAYHRTRANEEPSEGKDTRTGLGGGSPVV